MKTPAQLRALRQVHAARRGRRINGRGYTRRELEVALSRVAGLVREPERGRRSIRRVAEDLRVHERTVRRWLRGIDWPPAWAVAALARWKP